MRSNFKENKRAISEMISYMLLTVIVIGLAIGVYAYLKLFLGEDLETTCSEDIKLIIEEVSCYNRNISLSLSNRGYFNISAYFIRMSFVGSAAPKQLNKGSELFRPPLAPNKKAMHKYATPAPLGDLSLYENYFIEVQPATISQGRAIPCKDEIDRVEFKCSNGPENVCNNGAIEDSEECEFVSGGNLVFKNNIFGDGLGMCSTFDSTRFIGGDLTCSKTDCMINVSSCVPIPTSVCSDGVPEGEEQCDDGNQENDDACRNDCTINSGPILLGPAGRAGIFGNTPGFECDYLYGEGNTTNVSTISTSINNLATACNRNGCSANFQINQPAVGCGSQVLEFYGYSTGQYCGFPTENKGIYCWRDPSSQVICGDGLVRWPERCDDSNIIDGDGCSSTCRFESGWICYGQPSICAISLSSCAQISQNFKRYILSQDLTASSSCLTISANNIVLDGQGHSIIRESGGVGSDTGVIVSNVNNVTLKNISLISRFGTGISISNSANVSLSYLTIYGNSVFNCGVNPQAGGINILGSSRINISWSNITSNCGAGIYSTTPEVNLNNNYICSNSPWANLLCLVGSPMSFIGENNRGATTHGGNYRCDLSRLVNTQPC